MILILTNKFDITTDFVIRELRKRDHPYVRLNTEDLYEFSISTKFPDDDVIIETDNDRVNFNEDIGIVWNRRPAEVFEYSNPENELDESSIDFIRAQWAEWLNSLEYNSEIHWVNSPEDNRRMESKINQLRLARSFDFAIPNTIITNSVTELLNGFFDQNERIVAKALGDPMIESDDYDQFVYSTQLDRLPTSEDESLKLSPTIFQEPLVPKTDYRVTVVGKTVLPVEITVPDEGRVPLDWRIELDEIKFSQTDLPNDVSDFCRNYVDEAGLSFGAIDLVKVDGEFVFLEINPNGEWGWLEKPWNVPIAETLTSYLIENDVRS